MDNHNLNIRFTAWVGRVVSTCSPSILEDEFEKVGKVVRVETGYAGFAFVEFENEDDADTACRTMNKVKIQHVGEISVSRATQRGYEDARDKRDAYWRSRGFLEDTDRKPKDPPWRSREHPKRTSRSRSRRRSHSRSRRRRATGSRSRSSSSSQSRSRRGRSRSRSRRSRSRSRRGSKSSHRQRARSTSTPPKRPSPIPDEGVLPIKEGDPFLRPPLRQSGAIVIKTKAQGRAVGRRSSSSSSAESEQEHKTGDRPSSSAQALAILGDGPTTDGGSRQLSDTDRSAIVTFFDGASVPALLLEGSAALRVPDYFLPNVLSGLPHGFKGISQEGALKMLDTLSRFVSLQRDSEHLGDAIEVRHTLARDSVTGRRSMRKTLVIDGVECISEEKHL